MTDDPVFAYDKPERAPLSCNSVKIITGRWNGEKFSTKSGGVLTVNFGVQLQFLPEDYLAYDVAELRRIGGRDIRGLRAYSVDDLIEEHKGGKFGGAEFHRVRKELVFASAGEIEWMLEDVYGNKKVFIAKHFPEKETHTGILIPPFILHTYRVLKADEKTCAAGLVVIANTLFDHYDPLSRDTYSAESFRNLQERFK